MNTSFEERFWSKVDKSRECWIWTGACRPTGYGNFKIASWQTRSAHRVSWELHNGPIPDGMCVLHHCDVPACVRPDHLFLGTNKDNTQDMMCKGRRPDIVGERSGAAKLNEAEVRQIRSIEGHTNQAIADRFAIAQSTVSNIINRKSWRHI